MTTYSKTGWPLSKTNHHLTSLAYCKEWFVNDLVTRVERKYGIEIEVEEMGVSCYCYRLRTKPVKLSQFKYAQITAFIDGYIAASY